MKQITKSWIVIAIVVMMVFQDHCAHAQNKFNFGISLPSYLGTGRYDAYLDMKNELQGHTGQDALKFRPSTGIGFSGELVFSDKWGFEIYWQKYANKTNFGKNNADAFTASAAGSETSQYKMSHSIIGVGASRKTFAIKGFDIWIFSALSAGGRKFAWRPKGGEFSNERQTTNRLHVASSDAPMYFNIGLSPKFNFKDKFFFSPKIGYEMELLKATGMYEGIYNTVLATYGTNYSQADLQAIMGEYATRQEANLNRFFVELRVGMKLGKPY